MAKKDTLYFNLMSDMVEISCRASEKLAEILKNYDVVKLEKSLEELHKIEHQGDEKKHELAGKLAKEFITPIDREDILSIASEIDDVTDAIEDVLLKIYMFNIKAIRPDALAFSDIIVKCTKELLTLMKEFHQFKKSEPVRKSIVMINDLEEEGDALYSSAVRSLYTGSNDPIEVIAWTELYHCFEVCCDTCEHVANLVESVIMKNT